MRHLWWLNYPGVLRFTVTQARYLLDPVGARRPIWWAGLQGKRWF